MNFSHENLKVDQRALALITPVSALIVDSDGVHSIADHLPRAATNMVSN